MLFFCRPAVNWMTCNRLRIFVLLLACSGADAPGNMQWQTIAEGETKDKWERKMCGQSDLDFLLFLRIVSD